jgi:hypothetical protein
MDHGHDGEARRAFTCRPGRYLNCEHDRLEFTLTRYLRAIESRYLGALAALAERRFRYIAMRQRDAPRHASASRCPRIARRATRQVPAAPDRARLSAHSRSSPPRARAPRSLQTAAAPVAVCRTHARVAPGVRRLCLPRFQVLDKLAVEVDHLPTGLAHELEPAKCRETEAAFCGPSVKRMMGLEPTTFCMARLEGASARSIVLARKALLSRDF